MNHSLETSALILHEARKVLENNEPDDTKLQRMWLTLAYLQAHALANGIRHFIGDKVYSGPFKGMQLTHAAMCGAYAPALLGCYEWELHPAFEQAIKRPYKHVLNIGCSFGYYSVGLALRMPQAVIHGFDIDANARKKCGDMATLNQVQDRVKISGEFYGEDFSSYPPEETLALVDIEGAETVLLDPMKFPALKKMDVIVELHDLLNASISQTIHERFAPTHDIEIIRNQALLFDLEPIIGVGRYIDPFDRLLVGWENRDGPTPWAVMKAKK